MYRQVIAIDAAPGALRRQVTYDMRRLREIMAPVTAVAV
jgi:hypothetical protein